LPAGRRLEVPVVGVPGLGGRRCPSGATSGSGPRGSGHPAKVRRRRQRQRRAAARSISRRAALLFPGVRGWRAGCPGVALGPQNSRILCSAFSAQADPDHSRERPLRGAIAHGTAAAAFNGARRRAAPGDSWSCGRAPGRHPAAGVPAAWTARRSICSSATTVGESRAPGCRLSITATQPGQAGVSVLEEPTTTSLDTWTNDRRPRPRMGLPARANSPPTGRPGSQRRRGARGWRRGARRWPLATAGRLR
jgi:hypothetical protein